MGCLNITLITLNIKLKQKMPLTCILASNYQRDSWTRWDSYSEVGSMSVYEGSFLSSNKANRPENCQNRIFNITNKPSCSKVRGLSYDTGFQRQIHFSSGSTGQIHWIDWQRQFILHSCGDLVATGNLHYFLTTTQVSWMQRMNL